MHVHVPFYLRNYPPRSFFYSPSLHPCKSTADLPVKPLCDLTQTAGPRVRWALWNTQARIAGLLDVCTFVFFLANDFTALSLPHPEREMVIRKERMDGVERRGKRIWDGYLLQQSENSRAPGFRLLGHADQTRNGVGQTSAPQPEIQEWLCKWRAVSFSLFLSGKARMTDRGCASWALGKVLEYRNIFFFLTIFCRHEDFFYVMIED